MKRQKTPRQLVSRLHVAHLGSRRVNCVVEMLQAKGYIFAYHPQSSDPDRVVVYTKENDLMVPLLMQTYTASLAKGDGVAEFSRRVVEDIVGPLNLASAGQQLAKYGLVIMRPTASAVPLIATNPGLARIINGLRYHGSRHGRDHAIMFQEALGWKKRPTHLRKISDINRLLAEEIFKRFDIDAGGLLEDVDRSHPYSLWLMKNAAPLDDDAMQEKGDDPAANPAAIPRIDPSAIKNNYRLAL